MKYKTIDDFKLNTPVPLPASLGFPKEADHFFDRKQVIAILAALEINRPLLVRGEPGCGKTQLARAAAQVLEMPLACLVVNERTETEDLFWRYDSLRRLSDANTRGKSVDNEEEYLSAGPLWWALNHESAAAYEGKHSTRPYTGEDAGKQRSFANGVVLLIDEIDKADRSIPNGLLEALGNYSFPVPYINKRVECGKSRKPLIIITTNEEQELPAAFVRRCLVLDLALPEAKKNFIQELSKKGRARLDKCFMDDNEKTIFADIAAMLWEKRQGPGRSGMRFLPGQAEYFDHLEAILAMKKFDPSCTLEKAKNELARLTYDKGHSDGQR